MVTAYARIKLYQLIDRYREHVAYFDTDSVILFLPPNVPKPETSTMLGGLKDEVFDKWGYDARITSFCSLGPKSYSYTVNNSAGDLLESVTKMKGIRFNQETERTLCDGGLLALVNNPSKIYRVQQYVIARDLVKGRLYSKVLLKRVAFNSRKRQLLNDRHLSTVPYGYQKPAA